MSTTHHFTIAQALEEWDPDDAQYIIAVDNTGWRAVPNGLSQWIYATHMHASDPLFVPYDPCD